MNDDKESIKKSKNSPFRIVIWIVIFCPLLLANLQYLAFVLSRYGWQSFGPSFWGTLPQLLALLAVDLVAASFYLKQKSNLNWELIVLTSLNLTYFGQLLSWYTDPYLGLALLGAFPSFLALLAVDLMVLFTKQQPHGSRPWIINYIVLAAVSLVLYSSGILIFQFSAFSFIQVLISLYSDI